MNFIAHYYFYKNQDKHHNLGLVLPDLVKNFCKAHLRPTQVFKHPQLKSLNEGSIKHLQSDKKFHNSTFFIQCEDLISHLLDSNAVWPRKWFFNHLLSEILLDRVLIDKNPKICDEFYEDLRHINKEQVELYLKMSGINNYQNFIPALEKFVNIGFIYEYQHNEKIFFALGRVYSRLGIHYDWTETDKKLLLENIPIILNYIDLELNTLETELKQ
ncbi:MAG: hypothetical protein IT245_06520 [Bacteroidia bacterium]|nr:hypothetical protein [Bacteroidia bacterium]